MFSIQCSPGLPAALPVGKLSGSRCVRIKAASTEQVQASSNGAVPGDKLLDFDELTDLIRSDHRPAVQPARAVAQITQPSLGCCAQDGARHRHRGAGAEEQEVLARRAQEGGHRAPRVDALGAQGSPRPLP